VQIFANFANFAKSRPQLPLKLFSSSSSQRQHGAMASAVVDFIGSATALIVAAFAGNNPVAVNDLRGLIASVFKALQAVGQPEAQPPAAAPRRGAPKSRIP
jgi:predicted transcriptional regulator